MSDEMISVPRELLEGHLNKLYRAGLMFTHVEGLLASIDELRALLAKPAEQPQGEPEGYKYRLKSKNRAWTYSANRPEFAEEEFEILPLYTRPAEQPAPVAVVLPEPSCRQRLAAEGKPYPRSSCAVCGQFSPKWRECDALIEVARLNPPQQ